MGEFANINCMNSTLFPSGIVGVFEKNGTEFNFLRVGVILSNYIIAIGKPCI